MNESFVSALVLLLLVTDPLGSIPILAAIAVELMLQRRREFIGSR